MILGIEIGGTKLQLALGEQSGGIVARKHLFVERVKGAAGIREQIEQAIPGLINGHQLEAVGVGFGGPVDWQTGMISRSHHIEGWADFDLSAWLHQLTGANVYVDNDANVAALAEARHGARRGASPLFYVTLGSGVGGGLIVDGKIYHGAIPGEAEIGHLCLDRNGATVESHCSGWAVDHRIRSLKNNGGTGELCRMIGDVPGGEAKHLAAAFAKGDPAARKILYETADDLAFGLSHAVHLFHPEVIVLGGGLSQLGEPLLEAINVGFGEYLMGAFFPGPNLSISTLGEDAVPLGAIEIAKAL